MQEPKLLKLAHPVRADSPGVSICFIFRSGKLLNNPDGACKSNEKRERKQKKMNPVRKYENNPVLSAGDINYPASLIFNAGVCKFQGKYIMLFRDDVGYSKEGKTLPKP